MRKLLLVLGFLLLATAPASNQAIDQATLVANQVGNYTWKTSAPTSNSTIVDWSHLQTYINTKTCYMSVSARVVTWADVLACSSTTSATQHTFSPSGVGYGQVTCNTACQSGGGSPEPAQPYQGSFPANVVGASNPVAYNLTLTPGAASACSWTLSDGGGVTRASGTATGSGSLTTGTTGTWTLTVNETIAAGAIAGTCTVSGTITSYY